MKYRSKDIIAFPSSNSVDAGKLTTEENMRDIVNVITDRNYTLNNESFNLVVDAGKLYVSSGEAVINGYHIIVDYDDTWTTIGTLKCIELTNSINTDGVYKVGLRLSYDGTDHLLGDLNSDNGEYFEGVIIEVPLDDSVPRNIILLGMATYSNGGFSSVNNNPEKSYRIGAEDIILSDAYDGYGKTKIPPDRTNRVYNVDAFLKNINDWYVSKFGDNIYGTLNMKVGTYSQIDEATGYSKWTDGITTGSIILGDEDSGTSYSSYLGNNEVSFKSYIDKDTSGTVLGEYYGIDGIVATGKFNIQYNINKLDSNNITNDLIISRNDSANGSIKISNGILSNLEVGTNHVSVYKDSSKSSILSINMSGNYPILSLTGNSRTISFNVSGNNGFNQIFSLVNGIPDPILIDNIYTNQIVTGSGNSRFIIGNELRYGAVSSRTYDNLVIDGQDINSYLPVSILNKSSSSYIKLGYNKLQIENGSIVFSSSGNSKSAVSILDDKLNISSDINCEKTITASKVYNAVWNDLAEFYEKDNLDEEFEPGDIICISKNGKYTKSNSINCKRVVGVYSDSYGHILGGDNLENMEDNKIKYIPVGISGRVKVKCDTLYVVPGDLIVSSGIPGVGMTNNNPIPGTVIGKALSENIDGFVTIQIMLR